ncbi:hypothetical protein [Phycicoccus duodecadis]|uniref:Uncharacterized protein n=1 Tax=Phycicoccus duodecadis TaxID=173053 RepID=A0A2N3YJT2_9MICO|nr:hypothetical protein [Phycicoccus duodecadis]PKW27131.1 hypothetical protein ATL31_1967 [Phycicoccus duodecadis]
MTRSRRLLLQSRAAAVHPTDRSCRRERGDVPGWVLITLMTAALVTALWAVAEDQLVAMFRSALASVGG